MHLAPCDVQRAFASGKERVRQVISGASLCVISTELCGGSCRRSLLNTNRLVLRARTAARLQASFSKFPKCIFVFSHATAKTAKGANLWRANGEWQRGSWAMHTRACLNTFLKSANARKNSVLPLTPK
jgi:hypothetical protein